tara:strand:+ start:132 stop:1571 length:1440 start_codon:yes stop_codon:yes gene_type:complete
MTSSFFVFLLSLLGVTFLNSQDYSINFDGNNDYITILDHSDLDLTQNYTLEAWIFPETFSWLSGIISKYHTNASNGYILRLTNQSPYNGLGFDEMVTSTSILNSNQWYHIAAVNSNGNRRIFINGIEYNLVGSPLNISVNNNSVRIGSDYSSRYFDGRIDEVRIWNISRAQNDIVETMDTILSGQELGLVAYYNFNEGIGDTLFDQTGNGHNGILMGGASWANGHTLAAILGDVNFDEVLNIYDAVMIVAIMLGNEEAPALQLNLCDTNQDGIIDIEDIVLLFEWILTIDTSTRKKLNEAKYYINKELVSIVSNGDIAGFEIELSKGKLDLQLNLPSGWHWQKSNRKIVAYSINGEPLPEDFTFFINKPEIIKNFKIAGWDNKAIYADKVLQPISFMLDTYPNPFNPGCNILYEMTVAGMVKLELYDVNGRFIEIIKRENLQPGKYQFYWEPKNISTGSYFIKIVDGKHFEYKKILYLK